MKPRIEQLEAQVRALRGVIFVSESELTSLRLCFERIKRKLAFILEPEEYDKLWEIDVEELYEEKEPIQDDETEV